jgi:hypothetical protein
MLTPTQRFTSGQKDYSASLWPSLGDLERGGVFLLVERNRWFLHETLMKVYKNLQS